MKAPDDDREPGGGEQVAESLAEKFDLSEDPDAALPLRERLRRRTGLSDRGWAILVSVAVALPYPVFVYILLETSVDAGIFLFVTLLYSLVAIYVSSVL